MSLLQAIQGLKVTRPDKQAHISYTKQSVANKKFADFNPSEKKVFNKSVRAKWKASEKIEEIRIPNGGVLRFKYINDLTTSKSCQNGAFIPSGVKVREIPLIADFDHKQELPLFLFNENNYGPRIVACDFDTLPPNFDNWEDFRTALQSLYSQAEGFLVTSTPSLKAKVFALSKPSKTIRNDVFAACPYEFDKNANTGDVCFVTKPMVLAIKTWLESNPKIQVIEKPEPVEQNVKQFSIKSYKYSNRFSNNQKKLSRIGGLQLTRQRLSMNTKYKEFFFMVLSLYAAGNSTFNISQEILADSVGINRKTCATWLKEMVDSGVLRVTEKAIREVKSTTYELKLSLRFYLKRVLKGRKSAKAANWKDGQRYKTSVAWAYAHCQLEDEQLLSLVMKLPGILERGTGNSDRVAEMLRFVNYARSKVCKSA